MEGNHMTTKTFRPFIFIAGLMLLLAGCNYPYPTPEPTFLPFRPGTPMTHISPTFFSDDFSDCNLNSPPPPWAAGTNAGGYFYQVHWGSDCYIIFDGPHSGAGVYEDSGLMHYLGDGFTGIQPTYISFEIWSMTSNPDAKVGYFVLDGRIHPDQQESYLTGIKFYIKGLQFFVNGIEYDIPTNWDFEPSHVEFKNIQWTSDPPKFDLYVDGNLAVGCISFLNPIQAFYWVHLYNFDDGFVGFDNIYMGLGIGENAPQTPACGVPRIADLSPTPQDSVTPSPTFTVTNAVTKTFTPTATVTLIPVACADLDQNQCNQNPQCKWVPALTHANGGYCVDK
jgi:hypothetical protein